MHDPINRIHIDPEFCLLTVKAKTPEELMPAFKDLATLLGVTEPKHLLQYMPAAGSGTERTWTDAPEAYMTTRLEGANGTKHCVWSVVQIPTKATLSVILPEELASKLTASGFKVVRHGEPIAPVPKDLVDILDKEEADVKNYFKKARADEEYEAP